MPRIVTKTAHGPMVVRDKHICMCGLSANQPFCDGSHKRTLDENEDKLYCYTADGREEVKDSDECCGCCDHHE